MKPRALVLPGSGGDERSDQPGTDRGVSPVIAVVLLLGIAALLAAVAAPVVFGVVGEFGSDAPNAEFGFHYQQGQSLETSSPTDDFGTPVDKGTGLVTVQLERGDSLDPANIELRANVSGGNLLDDTSNAVFAPGDRVREGTVLTLTAVRDETVEVVWTGGDESAIIAEFGVNAPPTPGSSLLPDANRDCGYIEQQLDSGSNDIEIDGVVVECDLDQYYPEINNVKIRSENGSLGAVIGNVNGTVDISILNGGATFQGYVDAGADGTDGDITIKEGSTVYSNVNAKGDGLVEVLSNSTVRGDVDAVEGVTMKGNASISGDVVSGENSQDGKVDLTSSSIRGDVTVEGSSGVDLDAESRVSGDVVAPGNINLWDSSRIGGSVVGGTNASGSDLTTTRSRIDGGITMLGAGSSNVDVDQDSFVDGPIDAEGTVDVQRGTVVTGSIEARGKVNVKTNSRVDGSIIVTNGMIDFGSSVGGGRLETTSSGKKIDLDGSDIAGEVDPGGTLACDDSTILDNTCDEYKQPELAVDITDTNSPVSKGNSLQVDVTVENNGFGGTADVRLLVDGRVEKTKQKSIQRGGTDNDVQFQWDTSSASTGEHSLTVESDSEAEKTTGYVAGSNAPAFGVESVSADGSVFADNTLSVSATIKNSGQTDGNADVVLRDFDGAKVDAENNFYVDDGNSRQVTLEWDTTDSDIGSGNISVETDMDTETTSTEVLENVYRLEDVALYGNGQDLDVEVFLNVTASGRIDIEVYDSSGDLLDSRTENAVSDVYTMLESEQAKKVDGEVVVTLYDKNGDQRDRTRRQWNGGN